MKATATVGKTVIIYKDRFIYPLGPNITMLDNGEWLAGFNHSRRRERISHPPHDPLYRNLLTRSSDLGETWGEPYIAPGFDWSGVEHPGRRLSVARGDGGCSVAFDAGRRRPSRGPYSAEQTPPVEIKTCTKAATCRRAANG